MSARALPVSLPHLLAALALSSLQLVVTGCGDDGPECVIDTDCQLGFRCGATGRCERIGEEVDAGGGPIDAGPRDAAVADAAADAGAEEDAATPDAATDGGGACVALPPGDYAVEEPFVGCSFVSGSQVRVRAGSADCIWLLESIGDPVVDGEITIDAAGAITGPSLNVAGLGTVAGDGVYDPSMSRITLGFPPSDCVVRLVAP